MIFAAWLGAPWLARHGWEPIHALPAGVMLGGLLQLGLQVPALRQLDLLPRIRLSPQALRRAWQDEATRRILRLMAPALLGVGVAQISLLINTQIASHLAAGSVSWLSYADRLMEFPTAMLGVALGVVLMPQLAAAKAMGDAQRYAEMLDWGLRLVLLLALPCAVALLVFAEPLVAVLYHYGAFTALDVQQTTRSLTGYGVGLLGLVAIKVLAPGFYASQDIRTPVKIAVAVLCITQLLNLVFVPWLQHAGLALSIGLGAWVNALWLLLGLMRQGRYRPQPGWTGFTLRVVLATGGLAVLLWWAAHQLAWVDLRGQPWLRIGQMLAVLLASAVLYFGGLWAMGLRLKAFLRR
jgi:putative peptidoglycan lipid II flippase